MILPAQVADWPILSQLGWTLIHSLWQGLLVAAGLAVALQVLPRRSAAARYRAATVALVLLAVLPTYTFLTLDDTPAAAGQSPFQRGKTFLSLSGSATRELVRYVSPEMQNRGVLSPSQELREFLAPLLPWLVLGWLAGVGILSTRLVAGWQDIRRLRRTARQTVGHPWPERLAELAQRLGIRQTIALVESSLVEVPAVLGWVRPVILLPASALTGLTPAQLEAILVHELAHIRRHDYLVNFVQVIIETLFFYHPAAWWISARMRQEREHCCDDRAVSVCGDRIGYARALTRLEELRQEPPAQAPALAPAADGGDLLQRVRRVVGVPHGRPGRWQAGVALLLALVVAGVALAVSTPLPEEERNRLTKDGKGAHGPVEITIALDKQAVRAGEAVPVTITYTNTTRKTLVLLANGQPVGQGFPGETLDVTYGGDRWSYTIQAVDPAVQRVVLAPGKSWERNLKDLGEELDTGATVTHNLGREPFPKPFRRGAGDYTIHLRYSPTIAKQPAPAFDGSAQSNEVKLTIR
jgi:beta-lactamase regulating signal transducer with metallopeptidase domain